MIIESVRVRNFRSVLDETLYCDDLTALVGPNGAGKSTFLHALTLFYSVAPKIDSNDFYNEDIVNDIKIAITFMYLSDDAKMLFSSYLQGDKLTVERVFSLKEGKLDAKYYGNTLQCPLFKKIREGLLVKDRGKTAKEAYEEIRGIPEFNSLPKWSSIPDIHSNLLKWELENREKCEWEQDSGQFFGFKEVGQGYLGRFSRLLFIPAVRDASNDTSEGKGTVITELMDLVVRSVLANRDEIKNLKEETQDKYNEIMSPANISEINSLSEDLTDTLQIFAPEAKVDLKWLELGNINIPLPQAEVRLIEDGYSSLVSRTGHGLQRAFILTLLQHLALAQCIGKGADMSDKNITDKMKLPSLMLCIEEPELYQHPNRQRHLFKILMQLASGLTPGVADKMQIVYATHSPLFVGIDIFDKIRLLKKEQVTEGMPKVSKIVSASLRKISGILNGGGNDKYGNYDENTLIARLRAIMTPWMSEGFFSNAVVLVEGEDDRAAIIGVARRLEEDLEGKGISVIPCNGKTNLDRPFVIFREFGIPVYVIWDSDGDRGVTEGICEKCERPLDKKPDPRENHRLLQLVGKEAIDWPEFIEDNFACFKTDLERTIKNDYGSELFEKALSKYQNEFLIKKRKYAIKNPEVILNIIKFIDEENTIDCTLKKIVRKIKSLRN